MTGNLFSGAWAISEFHAQQVKQAILGGLFTPNPLGYPSALVAPSHVQQAADYSYAKWVVDYLSIGKASDVVVIPVTGTMTRGYSYDNYFSNTFIMQLLAKVGEDDSKKGAILQFNTGGGTVDSTDEFATAVANLNKIKPVVGAINYCASAGIWVASQCRELIMSTGPTAKVGSIGTIYLHTNVSKALEKAGTDVQIFRSTGSVDKARINAIEPLDEELMASIIADLDVSNKAFKGAVRLGRAGKIKSDELFTGKMYNTTQALSNGLADRTGDVNTAYQRVLQLSK
ncbi:hypothetical protein GO730_00600 [Spirosoma sp. HMF3257]|uniref:Peptidase S49 domain-containing protein n=1 Tax=Spirosoma telluris TaxID=2183553 RepID=A0A327NGA2_9BACT|nr:hypothetical protein [Spirosoma telluris]RAI73299.1 hypothetical protein HMF3257_00585 [Spirosoma telluris]